MRFRVRIADVLIRLGRFIQSTAVLVMRPHDLVEFNRRYYANPAEIDDWCSDRRIDFGLTELETMLLNKSGLRSGKLLLLGLGGGREAIALARMGFEVTGVDFIPQMVEQAQVNAVRHGVTITGIVREISQLELSQNSFDMTFLSAAMYSSIPTRQRRGKMLQKVMSLLRPGGYFILGYLWRPDEAASKRVTWLKKLVAWLTLGNIGYEKGDMLRFNQEFFHAFSNLDELRGELVESGFEVVDFVHHDPYDFAGAIVRKPSR